MYRLGLLAAALAFTVCSVVASQGGSIDLENSLFAWVNSSPPVLVWFFLPITYSVSAAGFALWCGIAWLRRLWLLSIALGLIGLAAWLSTEFFKWIIGRARPFGLPIDSVVRLQGLGENGFPSGHSAAAMACAIFLAGIVPKMWRPWLFVAAFAVGVSRIYLGAHMPLDVLGGWALGVIIGLVALNLYDIAKQRYNFSK